MLLLVRAKRLGGVSYSLLVYFYLIVRVILELGYIVLMTRFKENENLVASVDALSKIEYWWLYD